MFNICEKIVGVNDCLICIWALWAVTHVSCECPALSPRNIILSIFKLDGTWVRLKFTDLYGTDRAFYNFVKLFLKSLTSNLMLKSLLYGQ